MLPYINISELNDFIFCPYSIYIHHVYSGMDKGLYQDAPQIVGTQAHESIDFKRYSNSKGLILSLPISSDELGVMGRIDMYRPDSGRLIERKYQLDRIFRGQLYQIWAQYYCMLEMGYSVYELLFYEISKNKVHPLALPTSDEQAELKHFLNTFREFNPLLFEATNPMKCSRCIYQNLCDKTH